MRFYLVLSAVIILGLVFPLPGEAIHESGIIITILIMLMYFGLGVTMDARKIIEGLRKWREILFSQLMMFIYAPILAFVIFRIFLPFSDIEAMIGLMFVSALATTISSSIMLAESQGGDTVLSMYNVAFSQILGIFITPLVISIVLKTQYVLSTGALAVIRSLLVQMVIPFAAGNLLSRFRNLLEKPSKFVSNYSIYVILYSYISHANANGYLRQIFSELAIPAAAAIVFLILLLISVIFLSGRFGFEREERISMAFSCSQKTLGMGIPLAVLFFPDQSDVALNVTLIIMLYYIASMILSMMLVSNIFRTKEKEVS